VPPVAVDDSFQRSRPQADGVATAINYDANDVL
jgi:hypothetical protein